jgi:hypothetical protein
VETHERRRLHRTDSKRCAPDHPDRPSPRRVGKRRNLGATRPERAPPRPGPRPDLQTASAQRRSTITVALDPCSTRPGRAGGHHRPTTSPARNHAAGNYRGPPMTPSSSLTRTCCPPEWRSGTRSTTLSGSRHRGSSGGVPSWCRGILGSTTSPWSGSAESSRPARHPTCAPLTRPVAASSKRPSRSSSGPGPAARLPTSSGGRSTKYADGSSSIRSMARRVELNGPARTFGWRLVAHGALRRRGPDAGNGTVLVELHLGGLSRATVHRCSVGPPQGR